MPPELGVSLDKLSLEVCLSCLGWEAERLFYAHDESGVPRPIGDETTRKPQFPVGNLFSTQVKLAATGRRWRWQNWGLTNGRENLHRVGGHPTWIQSADYPKCPQCGVTMQFLMQLDSNLPIDYGEGRRGEWLWGSGGIGYVCWCDACRVSGFAWQCT